MKNDPAGLFVFDDALVVVAYYVTKRDAWACWPCALDRTRYTLEHRTFVTYHTPANMEACLMMARVSVLRR